MSISVIIPCYNAEKTIEQTIFSIFNQNYKPYEIIIVNDCSTDKSIEIIEMIKRIYDDKFNIKILNNSKNMGIGYTRQKGLSIAKGEFVSFLSSDDFWDKRFLEMCVNYRRYNLGVYCDYYNTDNNLNPLNIYMSQDFTIDRLIYNSLNRNMFINFSSIHFPRFYNIKFEKELRRGEDLIFLLDSIINGLSWKRISKPLVYYRKPTKYKNTLEDEILISKHLKKRLLKLGIDERYIDRKLNEIIFERHIKRKYRFIFKYFRKFLKL